MLPKGTGRGESLARLAERIRAVEAGLSGEQCGVVSTGWGEVDAWLPGGGLRRGATHEVMGIAEGGGWVVPASVVLHLARAGCGGGRGWTVLIGRRVWPNPVMAARVCGGAWLSRSVWFDPPDGGSRAWAIDAALRCGGVVVVADGTGLDSAGSRRLQLAAEAGGAFGLLVRPPGEGGSVSFAWSRWSVRWARPVAGLSAMRPRWVLTLERCKGGVGGGGVRAWVVEGDGRDGVVGVSAAMGDGCCAASAAG